MIPAVTSAGTVFATGSEDPFSVKRDMLASKMDLVIAMILDAASMNQSPWIRKRHHTVHSLRKHRLSVCK